MKNNNFEWNNELIQQCIDNNQYKKLNKKDKSDNTAFIYCCEFEPVLAIQLLERNDINFNIQNNGGEIGFIGTCFHQFEVVLKILERDNIDYNIQNKYGETGFIYACFNQPKLIIPMLNNKNIDTSIKDNNRQTGWDLVKEKNPISFKIYKSYIEEQKLKENYKKTNFKTKSLL